MIRMLNACTYEIDDTGEATAEILAQLNLSQNALENSVGIFTCHCDFIESGVVRAVCDALPFDVIGATSLDNGTNGRIGGMKLCLSVLTADDVVFSAAEAPSITETYEADIMGTVEGMLKKLPQKPKLIVPFLPISDSVAGDRMMEVIDKAGGGAPLFGTVYCDHTSGYGCSYTVFNGEAKRDRAVMLAASGNISPRFFMVAPRGGQGVSQKAIITRSEGNLLEEVNEMSAMDYLKSIGLIVGEHGEYMGAVPLLVTPPDGTRTLARAVYRMTEKGHASCGGSMPQGSSLAIGSIDADEVDLTARALVNEALEEKGINGMLMFPCLSRNLVLDVDMLHELEIVDGMMDEIPYAISYSGGEVCPVYDKEGRELNRYHNFTFVICVF